MLEFCNKMQMHLAVIWLFQNSQHGRVKVEHEVCSLLSAGAPYSAVQRDTPEKQ